MQVCIFNPLGFPECRYASHFFFPSLYAGVFSLIFPSLRTMDGRVTPIQLGKKDPHSDTDVCAFQCFSCRHVHSFICSLSFFERVWCVLRMRYVLPFMARSRLLTMSSVLYVFTSFYGVAPILLDPCFLCVRK